MGDANLRPFAGHKPSVMPNSAPRDEASCIWYSNDGLEYKISHPAAPGFEMTIPAERASQPGKDPRAGVPFRGQGLGWRKSWFKK